MYTLYTPENETNLMRGDTVLIYTPENETNLMRGDKVLSLI